MDTRSHTFPDARGPIPDAEDPPTDAWRPELATAERIRVLVADDEESVRDVLEALLESEP